MTGGQFLAREVGLEGLLTPERLDADALMMAQAAADYTRRALLPAADRIENKEPGLLESLLRDAGPLGLMGTDVPEALGGLGASKAAAARIAESLASEPSFAVSHSVHCNVASYPILLFGTPEQRNRYLPLLASATMIGAYALSESHAGTDAMAMRARAVLQPDGSYRLSGEKMWITNGAFADLFIVFAQTDEGPTAFIVERAFAGVSAGREEHKLGLHGSSTCRLILDDVYVSAENLLGAPGQGGKIALTTLNLGRFKIAASAIGQSKNLLGIATRYALQRVAFGRPIAEHGLIQEKLARVASVIYATESALYRTAGCLDQAFAGVNLADDDGQRKLQGAAEEFAIECALIKVACTECLDRAADETLQIHGGYGYTEEYPAARAWRDARVTRIYEGTNEINRLNVVSLMLRRIEKGRLTLPDPLPALDGLEAITPMPRMFDSPPYPTDLLRTATLHVLAATSAGKPRLIDVQGVAGAVSDMLIALYTTESGLMRYAALPQNCSERTRTAAGIARAECFYRALGETRACAALALSECGERGWSLWKQMERLLAEVKAARVTLRNALARAVIEAEGYPC